ncbi:MAG: hypothetical protein H7329_13265 [Opitutaceae bacterium]|nr:hypothetical protein [Cytophagales bacterium]
MYNQENAAMAELHQVLKTQSEFVKVHAAEYLIWLGEINKAKAAFLQEEKLHHNVPKYRVVTWRVLAQTETDPTMKKKWTDQVFKAFSDENGLDRIHAAETLGKLKLSPMNNFPDATKKILITEKENLYVYTLWASSHASAAAYEKNKAKFLDLLFNSEKEDLRRISAFILRREEKLSLQEWESLAAKALAEPTTSPLKRTMLNTTFATLPKGVEKKEEMAKIKAAMVKDAGLLAAGARIELALVLADKGDKTDLPLLQGMLENAESKGLYEPNTPLGADVRATAAYAILKIIKRK